MCLKRGRWRTREETRGEETVKTRRTENSRRGNRSTDHRQIASRTTRMPPCCFRARLSTENGRKNREVFASRLYVYFVATRRQRIETENRRMPENRRFKEPYKLEHRAGECECYLSLSLFLSVSKVRTLDKLREQYKVNILLGCMLQSIYIYIYRYETQ